MDITMVVNVIWDLATGVSVGLMVWGAWLCLNYTLGSGEAEASHTGPMSAQPTFR